MTVCNVKGGAPSDKPTENYYPTLQFLSALGSVLASFSSLLWFYGPQLYCFNSVLYQHCFHSQHAVVFSEKVLINPLYLTCPVTNNRQTKLATSQRTKWSI